MQMSPRPFSLVDEINDDILNKVITESRGKMCYACWGFKRSKIYGKDNAI